MKIGIIQGRLSEPKEGFQECPIDWKREFDLLQKLGLNHIEWIITSNFKNNPIFNDNLKRIDLENKLKSNKPWIFND